MTAPALPDSLQAIADLIGAPAALKIAERWGGTRLYIPAEPGDGHELSRLIGLDAASELGTAYGGDRVEIAKADGWGRALRNALIAEARRTGQSQAAVARAHGLTERHVRSIERGMDGDDRQGGLF